MKKSLYFLALIAVVIGTIAFTKSDKPTLNDELKEAFILAVDGNKAYTIELAEAMPADKYSFKPHDSVRSFGEQLAHMALSTKLLNSLFIKGEQPPFDPSTMGKLESEMGVSKEECIKALNETFDDLIKTYKGMDEAAMKETFEVIFDPKKPTFSKARGFEFIKEHLVHHRGQALVALRMQGIKAPTYRLY